MLMDFMQNYFKINYGCYDVLYIVVIGCGTSTHNCLCNGLMWCCHNRTQLQQSCM